MSFKILELAKTSRSSYIAQEDIAVGKEDEEGDGKERKKKIYSTKLNAASTYSKMVALPARVRSASAIPARRLFLYI